MANRRQSVSNPRERTLNRKASFENFPPLNTNQTAVLKSQSLRNIELNIDKMGLDVLRREYKNILKQKNESIQNQTNLVKALNAQAKLLEEIAVKEKPKEIEEEGHVAVLREMWEKRELEPALEYWKTQGRFELPCKRFVIDWLFGVIVLYERRQEGFRSKIRQEIEKEFQFEQDTAVKEEIEDLKAQLKLSNDIIQNLQDRLQEAQTCYSRLIHKHQESLDQISQLNVQISDTSQSVQTVQYHHDYKHTEESIEQLKEKYNRERQERNGEIQKLLSQNNAAQQLIADLNDYINELKNDFEAQRGGSCRTKYENLKNEYLQLQELLMQKDQIYDHLAQEKILIQEEVFSQDKMIDQLRAENFHLSEIIRIKENENKTLLQQLKQVEKSFDQVQREAETRQSDYGKVMTNSQDQYNELLDNYHQACKTSEDYFKECEWLYIKEKELIESNKSLIQQLKNKTDEFNAKEQESLKLQNELKELKSQNKSLQKNSMDFRSEQLKQIEELKERLISLESLEADYQQLLLKFEKQETTYSQHRHRWHSQQAEIKDLKNDYKTSNDNLRIMEATIKYKDEEISQLNDKLIEMQEQYDIVQKQLGVSMQKYNTLHHHYHSKMRKMSLKQDAPKTERNYSHSDIKLNELQELLLDVGGLSEQNRGQDSFTRAKETALQLKKQSSHTDRLVSHNKHLKQQLEQIQKNVKHMEKDFILIKGTLRPQGLQLSIHQQIYYHSNMFEIKFNHIQEIYSNQTQKVEYI